MLLKSDFYANIMCKSSNRHQTRQKKKPKPAFKVKYEGKIKSDKNQPILPLSFGDLIHTFETYSWISDHGQQFNCPGNTRMSGDFQHLLVWVKLAETHKVL